jgi:hypothetical protein
LNLTLLVDAQHQGMFRRIQVQATTPRTFLNKERIRRQLQCLGPVRLEEKAALCDRPRTATFPIASAIVRADQCEALGGDACKVRMIRASIWFVANLARRSRPALVRQPLQPRNPKAPCHLQTVWSVTRSCRAT